MNKKFLGGLFALGVAALCEKKPVHPLDGQKNLIKVNGVRCGALKSIQEENGYLILNHVMLDKHKIGEIFSNGFVVKPAQRIGMTLEIERGGQVETLTNVWIEDMTPYKEGQDLVIIDQMAVVIEDTEEKPEESISQMTDLEYFNYNLSRSLRIPGRFFK